MAGHGADGARIQQVREHSTGRNATLGCIGAVKDLVQQVEQWPRARRITRGIHDPLEPAKLRHEERHAGFELAVGRGLSARAASFAGAADDHAEAAALDRVLLDLAAAEADQTVTGERLVVLVANPAWGDLVGRDAADEWALGLEGDVFPGQLLFEESRVLRQKEDPSFDLHAS